MIFLPLSTSAVQCLIFFLWHISNWRISVFINFFKASVVDCNKLFYFPLCSRQMQWPRHADWQCNNVQLFIKDKKYRTCLCWWLRRRYTKQFFVFFEGQLLKAINTFPLWRHFHQAEGRGWRVTVMFGGVICALREGKGREGNSWWNI